MRTTILTKVKQVVVTQEKINRFADIIGDHNPVHVDPERAK